MFSVWEIFTLRDDPRCVDQMCLRSASHQVTVFLLLLQVKVNWESAPKKYKCGCQCGAGSGHLMDMAVYVHLYTCGDVMLT